MNKSPDRKKTENKKSKKAATGKGRGKNRSEKGTGIGGVQLGTRSDEKPSEGRKTSREVRDLG